MLAIGGLSSACQHRQEQGRNVLAVCYGHSNSGNTDTGEACAWQTAEEQLAELAAARAFAAADAEEAARKLAQLHVDLAAVAAERDQLRAENKLLFRKVRASRRLLVLTGRPPRDGR